MIHMTSTPAPSTPPVDTTWDDAHLGTPDPVRFAARVRMDKGEHWSGVKNVCSWCDRPALWAITEDGYPWAEVACDKHRRRYFPTAQVPSVSLVKAGVPAHGTRPTECDLRNRRQPVTSPWFGFDDRSFTRALLDNDLHTLAVAFEITANLRRSL